MRYLLTLICFFIHAPSSEMEVNTTTSESNKHIIRLEDPKYPLEDPVYSTTSNKNIIRLETHLEYEFYLSRYNTQRKN